MFSHNATVSLDLTLIVVSGHYNCTNHINTLP
jgi:hypothetical protein